MAQQSSAQSERIGYYDLLNVVSCLGVVALHCNGYVHTYALDSAWHQALVFEVLFYFSVPVFVMLSGATLMSYRERYRTKKFFRKRFVRTVIPWLAWSLLLGLAYGFVLLQRGEPLDLSPANLLTQLLRGRIPATSYWFFAPLFVFYLFLPFLSVFAVRATDRQLMACVSLGVAAVAVVNPLFAVLGVDYRIELPMCGGFGLLGLTGYALSRVPLENSRKAMGALGLLAGLSVVVRYVAICAAGESSALLMSYGGLYAFAPAAFVFLLCKRLNKGMTARTVGVLRRLSRLSFGVFLLHAIFINAFMHVFPADSPVLRYAGIPVVYLLSAGATWLLSRWRATGWAVGN